MCSKSTMASTPSCVESVGNKVDESIVSIFLKLGRFCSYRPKTTIALALTIAVACAGGIAKLTTENRPDKLWVPQNTEAEKEQDAFLSYFPPTSRFENVIASGNPDGSNVVSKERLVEAMEMHGSIETGKSIYEGKEYTLTDLCTPAGGTCASYDPTDAICNCLVVSVLKMWNYDLSTLQADEDILATLNNYGTKEDLEGVLGGAEFDSDDQLVSAEAISISYFLEDRAEVENGNLADPISEQWEQDVFLATVQKKDDYPSLSLAYLSSRSFSDEFGGEITGDLIYVNVSYLVALIFLGATLGSKFCCGRGSRWAMALSTLVMIALATVAGFGVASLAGLLYGPVHSVLPFVLLGIGVDDAFVIANAFDREREGIPRESETEEGLVKRGSRALARAGASITVTSLTDLVAFAISSTSALPALASFCAFASINIFFLWALAATFFTSTMVIDEKRQRDNRRDILCCFKRKRSNVDDDTGAEEGWLSSYFRKYHAPKILSTPGKIVVSVGFAALFGFGLYGAINLPVEDSERNFIPADSYIETYSETADEYFPSNGVSLFLVFEGGQNMYKNRESLAQLSDRVSGKSQEPPYIAEPNSDSTYRNMMSGLHDYLDANGSDAIGGAALGADGWPVSYSDFETTVQAYVDPRGPGSRYVSDLSLDGSDEIQSYRVKLEYIRLTKTFRGETIDDSSKQIESMDATREMVDSWTDLQPAFPYSEKFISIEGFKIIGTELYRNVGLAIACVGLIVFLTIGNIIAAAIITVNVAFCIIEILGFMFALGIVIDSVSVINIVLAVGLSIDYSAHVGHCFMTKGGSDKNERATESLADMGASVLNGALSTFLAVAVLLFSTSYVFKTLATQFALTVGLGVLHGLVLLPVVLSLIGPKPFASAEPPKGVDASVVPEKMENKALAVTERAETLSAHPGASAETSANKESGDTSQPDVGYDEFKEFCSTPGADVEDEVPVEPKNADEV